MATTEDAFPTDGVILSLVAHRDAARQRQPGHEPLDRGTTYAGDPLGRWHYIRYATGVVELYDLAVDPWELDDVADVAANADVIRKLDAFRKAYLREGRPPS